MRDVPNEWLALLGCSESLPTPALDYLKGFVPFLICYALISGGGFFVRLNGAPNYAMLCSVVAAVINIALDYVLIFVAKWGMFGAAFATGIGTSVGVIMMIVYLLRSATSVRMIALKISKNSIILFVRNVWYMCKLGFSSFMSELAIGLMMICGNYVFMHYMGEDGVAGFSIACYFFPIVFMLYTSIAQSAQPLISFNYGMKNSHRVKQSLLIALKTSILCGAILTAVTLFYSYQITSMFISSDVAAHKIATIGLPLFAVGFIPFAVNIVIVAYFQSIERIKYAFCITIIRGFVLMTVCFIFLPKLFGNSGVWLSVPISEIVTMVFAMFVILKQSRNS